MSGRFGLLLLRFPPGGKDEDGLTAAPAEGSVKAARLSLFFLPGRIALSRR
jgi:hypothetical protein